MKIAFIGTHGTGKTTLGHELVAELRKKGINANFVSETVRECPYEINENASKKAQEWIMFNQCVKEIEEEARSEIVICDRSVLDGYVYYINKFGENKMFEELVKEKIKEYDFIFRIPINPEMLKEDGVRSINPKFQKDIDEKFDFLLNKLSINYFVTRDIKWILEKIENARRTI